MTIYNTICEFTDLGNHDHKIALGAVSVATGIIAISYLPDNPFIATFLGQGLLLGSLYTIHNVLGCDE